MDQKKIVSTTVIPKFTNILILSSTKPADGNNLPSYILREHGLADAYNNKNAACKKTLWHNEHGQQFVHNWSILLNQ